MFHVKPTTESCVICASQEYQHKFNCKDFTVSGQSFGIYECVQCGFKMTYPRPEESEIGRYYKSEKYVSHTNRSFGLMSIAYRVVRKWALKKKYRLLKPYIKGKKILDIGCGTGAFVAYMCQKGYEAYGIEPDEDARKMANEIFNVQANDESFLSNCPATSFDLITMWHVLEHVMNLPERISTIYRILKHDGILCLALPNPNSPDANYYQDYWAAWDVPRHIWHFRPKDVSSLFEKFGFEIIGMYPMKFDAYYVSLLSEKYRGNAFYLFSGLFRGWLSNLKAKNGYYSSQIYLIQKKGHF